MPLAKILLLEDNEINRDMLTRRLQRYGYEVTTGSNGTEAVLKAKAVTPDVILMDMSMPVMDGWEATQQLKADDEVKHIPVIALTAHAMSGDREKALAVGCDSYDTKPIDFARLVGKIEAFLPDEPTPKLDPSAELPSATDENIERLMLRHLRHELCTPINAIIGYSEILLEEVPEAQYQELYQDLRKVYEAGLQLLKSTDAILNPAQLKDHPVAQDINSFSARVRLELLTPLSTVMGYCEMILEDVPDKFQSDLQRIDAAAQLLLSMTNDIVNLAQQQLQALSGQASVVSQLQLDSPASHLFAQTANKLIRSVQASTTKVTGGSILVVDDNELNCDLLSRQLERQGYRVVSVNSGAQALETLQAAAYDLVLLDIFMPDMNGLEVLGQIKQHPDWKGTPVIMISALDELHSVVHCVEMGAEDFLSKPFNPILLQAKIKACLEKKRLQDQQSMYIAQRLIAGATPVPIFISRIDDGQILYANLAAEPALGLSVEDLLNHSTLDFYRHPEDRQSIVAALSDERSVYRQEVECKRADGAPFWAAASMQPLTFDDEATVLTVLYDISDRKQAEHALKLAEENYRSIFENAQSGIYQSTPEGSFLRVNAAMAEIYGYDTAEAMLSEVTHISTQIYVEAADREGFQRLLREQGEVHGFEYQGYRQNGDIIWLSENARTVKDAHGQIAYYEGVVEEITQRKLDEAALKRQLEALKIEIDQTKRAQSVAEITQSDYFKEIQQEAEALRGLTDEAFGETVDCGVQRPPKILLVEDNELNRDMLVRRLRKQGYEVVIAVNGQEGIDKTLQERPDIVLMDMSLPVMDGWQATQRLKADSQTRQIPVIALTAHAMASDRAKALAAGCDEYDTKPIDWPRLLGKVDTLIAQAQERAQERAQKSTEENAKGSAKDSAKGSAEEVSA
ncbi:MAG: response regulator [Phormidesmis sp.]